MRRSGPAAKGVIVASGFLLMTAPSALERLQLLASNLPERGEPPMIGENLWGASPWLIILVVTLLLMGSHELGVQIRRRFRHRALKDQDAEGVGGSYLTASLSLLALLVAFSFGMAVDRFNTRRNLVLQEANAIASTYRRLETLDGPTRDEVGRSLRAYIAAREAFSRSTELEQLAQAETQSDAAQARLWTSLVQMHGPSQLREQASQEAADRMFEVAEGRRAALEAVVPSSVLFGMLLYATIAALLMGYSHPIDRRFLVPSSVQFVLLAIALALIVDLDRPRSGLVQVSQAPLLRVAASVRAAEAARVRPAGTN